VSTSPSQFINNPTSGVTYYAALWAGCIPNNGTSWTARVRAWSGVNGTGSLVTRTLTVWNNNYTLGTFPNSFTGSGINTADATSSNGTNGSSVFRPAAQFSGAAIGSLELLTFSYTGQAFTPTTPTFSPGAGAVGDAITLTGTRFTDLGGVWFNTVGDSTYIVNSDTSVTAHVPSGATTGQIQVGNATGNVLSATNFTVYQTPTISSFTPASGPPGTSVVITGTNYQGITGVDFNGVAASFVVNSVTQITATVPAGATVGRIHVINPAGTGTSATNFQPGQIFYGTSIVAPVAVWLGLGGAPVKIPGVWVKDGAGVKRIW
jgi:hypothetical protein